MMKKSNVSGLTFFACFACFALFAPWAYGVGNWRTYTAKEGVAPGKIQALWVEEGGVWVAAVGGVSRFDQATGTWTTYTEKEGLPSKDVRCLAGHQQILYAGTAKGVAVFDRASKRWHPLGGPGLPADPVNALLMEGSSIWIGMETGLLLYDRTRGPVRTFTTEDGLVDNAIRALSADGEQVFIGTVGAALHAYDRELRKIRVYSPRKQMFTNIVLAVERNRVWSGTNGGGIRVYNRTSGEWKVLTMKEGLSDDFLQSICVDGQYLWLGTFDGVSRYDVVTGNWLSFGVKDGLADGSVSAIAVDGEFIWFGTDSGVSVYEKGHPQVRLDLPATYVLSKSRPLVIPVILKSTAAISEAEVDLSTATFPEIWSPQGLTLRTSGGKWSLEWDVATLPTDSETVFLRVKARDARGRANEAVASVQVDTQPLQIWVDPLPADLKPGVWTVSGRVNKSSVEEVVIEPGNIKARVDAMGKRFSALVTLGPHLQELKVTAKDRFGRSASQTMPVRAVGTVETLVETQTISGTSVRLRINEKLLFDSGSAGLKPESRTVLLRMAEIVARNPKTLVKVEGHTDDVPLGRGSPYQTNLELSQARAKGVYDFLLANGIHADRLTMAGYGDSQPVASNATDEGRAQNRRVEILIEVEE